MSNPLSGACVSAGCGCASFASQLYRPALCLTCFHSIGQHFPDQWRETVDPSDRRVYFVNVVTNERLYARPADATAALSSHRLSAHVQVRPPADGDASAGAVVTETLAKWASFAPQDNAGKPARMERRSEPAIALGRSPAEPMSAPAREVQAAPAPASSPVVPETMPATPTAVSAAVLSALSLDVRALLPGTAHTDATHTHAPVAVPPPAPASSAAPSEVVPSAEKPAQVVSGDGLAPSVDTHKHLEPVEPMAADLLSSPSSTAARTLAVPSVASHVAIGTSTVALSAQQLATGAHSEVESERSDAATTVTPAAVDASLAAVAADIPPQPRSISMLPPAALMPFLEPVYGDPLCVDIASMGKLGDGLVAVFPIRQPYEENVELHRYLVLTPFTLMALAAHPTRLGWGFVKWERSVLSLRNVSMQPLYAKTNPRSGTGRYSLLPEGAVTPGSAAPAKPASGMASFFRRTTPSPATSPAITVTDAGIGVLASFAPETRETAALLRTYRAGKRPVLKEGWLVKKKQGDWRDKAPLGPLAWKRRYFLLSATELTYFSGVPGQKGAALKGSIPLNGWVEVMRVTSGDAPQSSTAAPSTAFVLRTGTSYHTFQASSTEEANGWIDAITINAQHLGAASHEPQQLIVSTAADALKITRALQSKYMQLTEAMEAEARDAARATFSVDTELSSAVVPQGSPDVVPFMDSDEDEEIVAAKAASLTTYSPASTTMTVPGYAAPPEFNLDAVDAECGLSLRDVLQLADASGGGADEFLSQLPPHFSAQVRAYLQQQPHPQPPGAVSIDPRSPIQAAPGAAAVAVVSNVTGQLIVTPSAAPLSPHTFAGASSWVYLDDSDRQQGPFVEGAMHAWLHAGYFKPHTLVRYASPVPTLDVTCGVDSFGVPQVFLPLFTLFPDPKTAFCGDQSWVPRYEDATRYQALVTTALQLGLDRSMVVQQVQAMRAAELPPDISLLMDLCGVRELPAMPIASVAAM